MSDDQAEAYRNALLIQHVHAGAGGCHYCTANGCRAASWSVQTIGRIHAERERERLAVLWRNR